jgi:hypothetical protein
MELTKPGSVATPRALRDRVVNSRVAERAEQVAKGLELFFAREVVGHGFAVGALWFGHRLPR